MLTGPMPSNFHFFSEKSAEAPILTLHADGSVTCPEGKEGEAAKAVWDAVEAHGFRLHSEKIASLAGSLSQIQGLAREALEIAPTKENSEACMMLDAALAKIDQITVGHLNP